MPCPLVASIKGFWPHQKQHCWLVTPEEPKDEKCWRPEKIEKLIARLQWELVRPKAYISKSLDEANQGVPHLSCRGSTRLPVPPPWTPFCWSAWEPCLGTVAQNHGVGDSPWSTSPRSLESVPKMWGRRSLQVTVASHIVHHPFWLSNIQDQYLCGHL